MFFCNFAFANRYHLTPLLSETDSRLYGHEHAQERPRATSRPKEGAGSRYAGCGLVGGHMGKQHEGGGAAAGYGKDRSEERATLAFLSMKMLRKSQESPADRRKGQQEAGSQSVGLVGSHTGIGKAA